MYKFIKRLVSKISNFPFHWMLSHKERIMLQVLQSSNQPSVLFKSQQNNQFGAQQPNPGANVFGQQNPGTTSIGTGGFGANNTANKAPFTFNTGGNANTTTGFGLFNNNNNNNNTNTFGTNNQQPQQPGAPPIINFDNAPTGQTTKQYEKPEKLVTSTNQHLLHIQSCAGITAIEQPEKRQLSLKFRPKGTGRFVQNIERVEMLCCGLKVEQ